MTTLRAVRAAALALPGATEQDHHGIPSFRVTGKVFATVPDDAHVRVMVDEPEVLAAIATDPVSCAPLHWGARLAGVVVTLRTARLGLVAGLLEESWARRAPATLRREHGAADR